MESSITIRLKWEKQALEKRREKKKLLKFIGIVLNFSMTSSDVLEDHVSYATLYAILKGFNLNNPKDCLVISEKFLKEAEKEFLGVDKALNPARVLLKICVRSIDKNANKENLSSEFRKVIESLKKLINFYIAHISNDFFDKTHEKKKCILSIVSSVFKFQHGSDDWKESIEIHDYILDFIKSAWKERDNSQPLMFGLDVLTTIYEASTSKYLELGDKSKEIQTLFVDIVLRSPDDQVVVKTAFYLIPAFHKFDILALEGLWMLISESMSKPFEVKRVLMLACKHIHTCFVKDPMLKEYGLVAIRDRNFWSLIKAALLEEDPSMRKQGRFLLQETLNAIENFKFVTPIPINDYNWWCSDPFFLIFFKGIIRVSEFLEEQQFHIIEPIFAQVKQLEEEMTSCFQWIFLIYKRAISHKSTQVMKWGLSNFFKLQDPYFEDEAMAKSSAQLLAEGLRNPSLYYSDSLALVVELRDFFERFTGLGTSKIFFSHFIKAVCLKNWSPETLFFVMHSLSGVVKKFSFWGKNEISVLKAFVPRAFETHDINIRIGSQYELIRTVSNFTDETEVHLEDVIVFISKFSTKEIVRVGSPAWEVLTDWLRRCYSSEQFETVLEKHEKKELGAEFNSKCTALTLILFHCTHQNSSALKSFQKMIASFDGAHKRPYCEISLLDEYLSIIKHIHNISDAMLDFKKACMPFVKDIILYVYNQLRDGKHFGSCQMYLSAFEIIIENSILFGKEPEDVNDLLEEISSDLESSQIAGMELYWRIKILRVIFESYEFEPKNNFLLYLLKHANEPLNISMESWELKGLGKVKPDFIIEKWKILSRFVNRGDLKEWLSRDEWVELSLAACSAESKEIFDLILPLVKNGLPSVRIEEKTKKFLLKLWEFGLSSYEKFCLSTYEELTHTPDLAQFGQILYHEYINRSENKTEQEILLEIMEFMLNYDNFLYDEFLPLLKIFDHRSFHHNTSDELCRILTAGLTTFESLRKDQRLTRTVYSYVEALKIYDSKFKNNNVDFCATCIGKVLKLDKNRLDDQKFARSLINSLLKKDDISHRSHYEGSLLKLRITQALLLLEPMLSPNEETADTLSKWAFESLTTGNLHLGVRRLQEWLLIRIFLRHPALYVRYGCLNDLKFCSENGRKGLCSLMAISFHLCRLLPSDEMEKMIWREIASILSFVFHQNFEVRLNAMVVFQELYKLAEKEKMLEIMKKYEGVYTSMREIIGRSLKGNVKKNVSKIMGDFFFQKFHPLDHYSVRTIYMDLPKLTHVDPDTCIEKETFERSGVELDQPKGRSLVDEEEAKEGSNTSKDSSHVEYEATYYQRKMIPMSSLFPGVNDDNINRNAKLGQLIVVASLVDCVPNLGGLARSCEVFGAKFVIHSLKHIQDKQFTSLSVTAEKWINIEEVKMEALSEYLIQLSRKGYTVIGAEQAVGSTPLGIVKFPRKSVLLLGNEKKGIPPYLLPLVDICVEIPQLGKIRSLNVHVAGALFMWEYAKRNLHF